MSDYSYENPSPRFRMLGDLYREMHEKGTRDAGAGKSGANTFPGGSLLQHIATVEKLARHTGARSILDYGSGKGVLYQQENLKLPDGRAIPSVKAFWGVDDIRLYDPGVEEHAARPQGRFDGLVSTDVLEHIPEEDIDWVLGECFAFARKFVYMNIASYPAQKVLPNGWNAHITIKSPEWWRDRVEKAASNWDGMAYVFEVSEKRKGFVGNLVRRLGGGRYKLTRIESWR